MPKPPRVVGRADRFWSPLWILGLVLPWLSPRLVPCYTRDSFWTLYLLINCSSWFYFWNVPFLISHQCLNPLVLSQGQFFPQGGICNVWRHFPLSLEVGCHWHVLGRGQRCCWTSAILRTGPTAKTDPTLMLTVPRMGHPVLTCFPRHSCLNINTLLIISLP